jgi:uncharacterized Tic20 family protein
VFLTTRACYTRLIVLTGYYVKRIIMQRVFIVSSLSLFPQMSIYPFHLTLLAAVIRCNEGDRVRYELESAKGKGIPLFFSLKTKIPNGKRGPRDF